MAPPRVRLYLTGGLARHVLHLLRLPIEVLRRIFSSLDKATLTRVVRTHRFLYATGMPILYRDIGLNSTDTKFLECVRLKPNVRELVYNMIVHDHSIVDVDYIDALSAEICQMKKLENLSLSTGFSMYMVDQARFRMVFTDIIQAPVLRNLKSLTLNLSTDLPWEMASREIVFAHPSLETLSLCGMKMGDFPSFRTTISHTSPLKTLRLLCCDISPVALFKILSVPRALTKLIFTGAPQQGDPQYATTNHADYARAMRQQAHSLASLEVGFWHVQTTVTRARQYLNFSGFLALRELIFIPGFIVFGFNPTGPRMDTTPLTALPPSLEHFAIIHTLAETITDLEDAFVSDLSEVFRAGHLPNLRLISFVRPTVFDYADAFPLPPGRVEAFVGRVQIIKHRFQLIKSWPLNCWCCQYDLGARFVDDRRVGTNL